MMVAGTVVPGAQWFPWRTTLPSPSKVGTSPFAAGVAVLCAIRDLAQPAEAFQWDGSWFGHPGTELIDFYAGTPTLRERLDAGASAADIVDFYQADVALFRQRRQPFLLY